MLAQVRSEYQKKERLQRLFYQSFFKDLVRLQSLFEYLPYAIYYMVTESKAKRKKILVTSPRHSLSLNHERLRVPPLLPS